MEGEQAQQQGQPDIWQEWINEYNRRYTLLENEAVGGEWENFDYFKEAALILLNRFKSHLRDEDQDFISEYKSLLLEYSQTYNENELSGLKEIRENHYKFTKLLKQYGIDKVLDLIAPPI